MDYETDGDYYTEEVEKKAYVCCFESAILTMPTPPSHMGCDDGKESITGSFSITQMNDFPHAAISHPRMSSFVFAAAFLYTQQGSHAIDFDDSETTDWPDQAKVQSSISGAFDYRYAGVKYRSS
ncbi:uncharacterized protein FPRO_10374 [Fusarium proliferatum ET1]|uniref:Uncharacterized protein n=1 Tax=Fusarium proliferatum (strain ET1) TaxID=1227346 RepID=A0A1L7VLM2_FUSPR|nr:uncharacterized protein FPRO_10374 [Fusarium proliferatum ET1]CZR40786.1 uncharacterized protein FPRO_10374 [Fusarium proliferatum ET1]